MNSTERLPAERWNFATLFVQGVARRVGNELGSEKLVLPFLYTALGGAVLYSGLFAPVVIIARLLAQLLGSRLIGMTRKTHGYLALATTVVAAVLAGVAGLTGGVPMAWLPVVFIAASAVMGMSNGFGALTAQDMMGRVLGARSRTNLLFAIGAASGAGVIVTTLASQLLTGFAPREATPQDHAQLVWIGAGMLLLSSLGALAVRETPRALPSAEATGAGGRGYMASLFESIRIVSRLAWFRRFVVARMLLLSVELPMPFFAVHAATFHAQTTPSLTYFVISLSLGMIGGGLVWPQLGRKSIQLVLSASPLVAGLAALLAFLNHIIVGLQSPFTHAAAIFFLAFGTQGALDGSTAYVVGSATDEERPYCIAVANLAAGIVGVGVAFGVGLIAHYRGIIVAIVAMGVLNVITAVYARALPSVRPLT
jgi:hypothetical protein